MNYAEMVEQDEKIRARLLIRGTPEQPQNEAELTRFLVANSLTVLPDYPLVVRQEWAVVPGLPQYGVGDLVFARSEGELAVVEVKFLNTANGHTARESRRRGRQKVERQAHLYGEALKKQNPEANVAVFTFTNADLGAADRLNPAE